MPEEHNVSGAYERATAEKQAKVDKARADRFSQHNDICNTDDPVCFRCLQFYAGNLGTKTKFGPTLPPACELSTVHHMDDVAASDWWKELSREDQQNYQIVKDPVSWAAARLRSLQDSSKPWEPIFYQIEPLCCTSNKILLLFGRQLGKTEILAVKCLYFLDTRPNYKIVLVAPFQTQVDEFFTRIRDLYAVSPEIKERVVIDHRNPINEIKLNNGSYIRGFTAGAQTGKAGTDVRGQPADLLVMDEADYLDDDTIVAIFATLIRASNPMLLVSSTPTGRRQKFYTWATDLAEGFRVLHYTSMCAPTWTDELELFYRRNYPKIKFQQEFMAEFGEAASGVFRHQDIDACTDDYNIMDATPVEGETYIMGVDWNMKGTGGTIILVGYDAKTQKFRAAYKEIIDPTEFTQTHTVDRIVNLNRIWKPSYIYVDYGHGDTQVELLEQYGLENPETRLHRKVRGISMGKNIKIRDPLTRKKVDKQAKNLMVELAVSRMEAGQCTLPKGEDHRHGLLGQMRNFEVKHMGRGDNKVYTGEEEHLLVAWMLAIMGFVLEYSDITKIQHTSDVIFTDSNLERIRKLRDKKAKPKPAPLSRNRSIERLNPVDSINYAKTGLPPALRRRMDQGSPLRRSGPVGRKRWR